ncbi:MAG: hypothetical protein KGS61_10145 [Verrucomicrobia bacterium]|nr:hypothetical protein [Verrucomicrobiota bacterium]
MIRVVYGTGANRQRIEFASMSSAFVFVAGELHRRQSLCLLAAILGATKALLEF